MAEIERKFLLLALPVEIIQTATGEEILQGYLLVGKGELRIRRKGDRNYITVKSDGTLSRDEWESEVPAWVFNQLWLETKGRRIEKTRYSIAYDGLIIEVDVYRGHLAGLVTLECEFPNEGTADKFELPEWAKDAVEITADKAYKNKNLAVKGLPKEV